MIEKLEINLDRILYLMQLFGLDKKRLLKLASDNPKLKNPLKEQDIFVNVIKKSHLKRVDKIFEKGLSFYTDPAPPPKSQSSSIFFRKNTFNSKLELGDRELIHKMECRIHSLSALCKLANHKIERKIRTYTIDDVPQSVAKEIRQKLYPENTIKGERDFLKTLIKNFAEYDILILEFVETWNKKNKTNLNGFFIAPNHIIIKRQQKSLKREIFTLAHELGHYLLNEEEIDHIQFGKNDLSDIERWCNTFAFAFLIGQESINFIPTNIADSRIQSLSEKYHISRLALFTHLATNKIISWQDYNKFKQELDEESEQKELKKQLDKSQGKRSAGRSSQPIFSPLEKDIYASAYFEGVVDEYRILSHFKEKDLDKLLYG